MAKNIEMQYFNGSSYEIVYPKTDTTNILHNGETLSSFLDNIQDNIEITDYKYNLNKLIKFIHIFLHI